MISRTRSWYLTYNEISDGHDKHQCLFFCIFVAIFVSMYQCAHTYRDFLWNFLSNVDVSSKMGIILNLCLLFLPSESIGPV